MKNIIYCYLLRYSVDDTLTGIGSGFALASEEPNITTGQKEKLITIATRLFELRNELRKGA